MSVRTDLDWCQGFLKDAEAVGQDGLLWSRQELLDYYLDGYRQLLDTSATRRWTVLSVPPQWTCTGTQAWEGAHAAGGTFWQWTFQGPGGGYSASFLWELEQVEGYAVTQSSEGITQGWEREFVNPTYTPFRFALRRDHSGIVRMWYDHRVLLPVSVRELDATYRQWTSVGNYPLAWTIGTGDERTFEVYEVQVVPTEDYGHTWDTLHPQLRGMVRQVTGSRTYTVEEDPEAGQATGLVRDITSPDRQYWPIVETASQEVYGKPDKMASSTGALLVLETITQDVTTLTENDSAGLLPAPMQKYCRYYVLARAFGRQGEGYNPEIAAIFAAWFESGTRIMRRLGMLARKDAQWARRPVVTRGRPPRPHLPSGYPYVGRI